MAPAALAGYDRALEEQHCSLILFDAISFRIGRWFKGKIGDTSDLCHSNVHCRHRLSMHFVAFGLTLASLPELMAWNLDHAGFAAGA